MRAQSSIPFSCFRSETCPGISLVIIAERIGKAHTHLHSNYKTRDESSKLRRWEADRKSLTRIFIHGGFSSTVCQMTMKMRSQGLDYSGLVRFLSLKTDIVRYRSKQVKQETVHAKIVAGSLLFRHQIIYLLPPAASSHIPFPLDVCWIFVCDHVTFRDVGSVEMYLETIQAPPWDDLGFDQHAESRLVQFKYCWTEHRIDFKQFGDTGDAIYITR